MASCNGLQNDRVQLDNDREAAGGLSENSSPAPGQTSFEQTLKDEQTDNAERKKPQARLLADLGIPSETPHPTAARLLLK